MFASALCFTWGALADVPAGGIQHGVAGAGAQKTPFTLDLDWRGPQGDTQLHWAAFHGRKTLAEELIAMGADVNAKVANGTTPLHHAAYRGHVGIVALLIAHGADINARNQAGLTPLDWAVRNAHHDVNHLLQAHGATGNLAEPESGKAASVVFLPLPVPSAGSGEGKEKRALLIRQRDQFAKQQPQSRATPMPPAETSQPPQTADTRASKRAFRIQLAALSARERATDLWGKLKLRYPDLLGGLALHLETVRGSTRVLYRVQAGPLSKTEARRVCELFQRRNRDCMVVAGSTKPADQGPGAKVH
jgi:hypothetical protein